MEKDCNALGAHFKRATAVAISLQSMGFSPSIFSALIKKEALSWLVSSAKFTFWRNGSNFGVSADAAKERRAVVTGGARLKICLILIDMLIEFGNFKYQIRSTFMKFVLCIH